MTCACGCGEPAPLAKRSLARLGHVKGQPVRFICGHNTKLPEHRALARTPERRAQTSTLARRRDPEAWLANIRRGESHADWKGEEASYRSIHAWLQRTYPKTGVCEECGEEVGSSGQEGTHYAFLHHPEPNTRNREDYRELCPTCHFTYDVSLGVRPHQTKRTAA